MGQLGRTRRISSSALEGQVDREREFWDGVWREGDDLSLPDWTTRDPWALGRQELLGPVDGRRLLDVGCGTGVWSVFFATRGADVDALDISAEGVRLTQRRARRHGVSERVRARVASAYELPYTDGSFELIHGENILHHLDVDRVGPELRRVLKPGGVAVFAENSASNGLLMLARRLCGHFGIPKWSSDDEYPLRRKQIDRLASVVGPCTTHFPAFSFFRLLDEKVFPGRRVTRPLDDVMYRFVPAIRKYSYHQLLRFTASNQQG